MTRPGYRPAEIRAAGWAGGAVRCLIVDDSSGFLDAARRLLERQGMTVAGVARGSVEALRRVEELRPDVVLVDIYLGGESGLELVRRLERARGAASSRFIVISTHAKEDYHDAIAAGPAAGFLPKAEVSAPAIRRLLDRDDQRFSR